MINIQEQEEEQFEALRVLIDAEYEYFSRCKDLIENLRHTFPSPKYVSLRIHMVLSLTETTAARLRTAPEHALMSRLRAVVHAPQLAAHWAGRPTRTLTSL